jgi:DNA-binding transcriptional MerR regulator
VTPTLHRVNGSAHAARPLRIGQVAERAGVNIQTLRYYERRGLLDPERRHSGHREYDHDAVRLVRTIKAAQGLGFTLAEIEDMLALTRRRGGPTGEIGARARTKIDEIDQKIAQLQAMRASLEAVVEMECDSLTDCACAGDCPIAPDQSTEGDPRDEPIH